MSGFLSSMVGATYGPPAPTYAVAAAGGATSVNEGSSLTFNVTTTDVADSTTLFYTVSANSGDFGTSSGSFTITSNAGSFSLTPTADVTTEGAETFAAQIRTVSTSGTVVATSATITINDTSLAPTYAVAASGGATNVNEGSSLTFNVTTANVANGTTLYYTVSANSGDFGTSSGSFTITSNAGSFSLSPTADVTTEGSETFAAQVRTGSTGGTVVATSGTITILDTSIAPNLTSVSLVNKIGGGSAGATANLSLPASTAVGDLVIYCCQRTTSGQNIPTGWTLLAGDSNNPVYAFWSYKIMTAGDISTGSISHTGSTSNITSKFAVTLRGNIAITQANYRGFVQSTLTGSSNSIGGANQSFVNKDLGLILLAKSNASGISQFGWSSDASAQSVIDDNNNNALYFGFQTATVTRVGTTTSWSSSAAYVQHRLKIPLV
jgi:hypothetical protein